MYMPLEGLPIVGVTSHLELPGSLVALEDQQSAIKGWNQDDSFAHSLANMKDQNPGIGRDSNMQDQFDGVPLKGPVNPKLQQSSGVSRPHFRDIMASFRKLNASSTEGLYGLCMQVGNRRHKHAQVKNGGSASDGVLHDSRFDILASAQEDVDHSDYHKAPSRLAQGVQTSFLPSTLAKGKSAQKSRADSSKSATLVGSVEPDNTLIPIVLGIDVTDEELVVIEAAQHHVEGNTDKSVESDMPIMASIEEVTHVQTSLDNASHTAVVVTSHVEPSIHKDNNG
ncbi:hypothetical protein V6N11_060066 [Hibiscus sabdariffa]|uniref:Uncharacterized protein n=1 Tax=Hibiscus sabdariffa TaxID=183260 RepID=A0ABR2ACZ6_9ROSI